MAGVKFDTDKPRMDLIPSEALKEVAKVMTFGAEKYGDHNWREGMDWHRMYGAAQRHLNDWNTGRDHDDETGLPELAHAACCILMLLSYQKTNTGKDDRYVSTVTESGVHKREPELA